MRSIGPILPVIDMEQFERERRLLPPMPEVMSRIDSLLRSGETDVSEITEAVITEVSLVTRILRVVNSAYYSLPREISNITQAVAFLGFTEIHRLVLTSSIANAFKDANPIQLRRYWTHSYYTALIAKELSRRYEKQLDPGELWPCALLHDVGELVYMRLYGEHYSALVRYQLDEKSSIEEAEDALNLPSHRLLAELGKHWNLPDSIRDVCAHHGLSDEAVPAAREQQREACLPLPSACRARSTRVVIENGFLSKIIPSSRMASPSTSSSA